MVSVKLSDLNIVPARGRYYVYRRSTGETLIKGFEGTLEELKQRLAQPDFLSIYNRHRVQRKSPTANMPLETLGGFVHWFTNGDIDRTKQERKDPARFVADHNGYPKWRNKFAETTRDDYIKCFEFVRAEFDIALKTITQSDLYDVRDRCANQRKTRFADKLITSLSSLFRQAVRRGKFTGVLFNPCAGMDRVHIADPNANREWRPDEWQFVRENAPTEMLIPFMLARYAGLRGQTIIEVNRRMIEDHPETGKAIRYTPHKNMDVVKVVLLPMLPELQEFLAILKVERADGLIAHRDSGSKWGTANYLQKTVSGWLREQEHAGNIGAGTTLHGLRVSYAAWWKRRGASNREVADLLGDESEAMGAHYTRHVEAEISINRSFERIKNKP